MRPSYLLYFVLCLYKLKQLESRSWCRCNWGAAAETDTIEEQQLKRIQSRSSRIQSRSSNWNGRNRGISSSVWPRETAGHTGDYTAHSQNLETAGLSWDCTPGVLHNCTISVELSNFPLCIKVGMHLRSSCSYTVTINIGHVVKPSMPGTSGRVTNSEKLPSPQSGYGHRETPDLWSAPVQAITWLTCSVECRNDYTGQVDLEEMLEMENGTDHENGKHKLKHESTASCEVTCILNKPKQWA